MSYLKLFFVGNLGSDPDSRFTPGGKRVTNFSVAVNRAYTDSNGEKIEEVTWLRVSCWGRLAETTDQYLKKGSKVLIEGRLRPDPDTGGPRVYTRGDGTSGASFEITAQSVLFLSSREEDEAYRAQSGHEQIDEDDIPF